MAQRGLDEGKVLGGAGRRLPALLMALAGATAMALGHRVLHLDKYVELTQSGWAVLDLTGWGWADLAVGVVNAAAGLLVLSAARWTVVAGLAVAVAGLLFALLLLPYVPLRGAGVAVLNASAIWLLARQLRQPHPPAERPAAGVNGAGRPDR